MLSPPLGIRGVYTLLIARLTDEFYQFLFAPFESCILHVIVSSLNVTMLYSIGAIRSDPGGVRIPLLLDASCLEDSVGFNLYTERVFAHLSHVLLVLCSPYKYEHSNTDYITAISET